MARRDVSDEKRSYGTVFLLSVGLLLAASVWAFWDDSIARRPWKKYQAEFYRLAHQAAVEELRQEERRLAGDEGFRQASEKLAAVRADMRSGQSARRLDRLRADYAAAKLRAGELETDLRLVKSEMDAAWY